MDGSSSRPDINPAAQPRWVDLELKEALERMLPQRIRADTIQVGILTEPGWVPPSDMTSCDKHRISVLLDLAGVRISQSDLIHVKRVIITCQC